MAVLLRRTVQRNFVGPANYIVQWWLIVSKLIDVAPVFSIHEASVNSWISCRRRRRRWVGSRSFASCQQNHRIALLLLTWQLCIFHIPSMSRLSRRYNSDCVRSLDKYSFIVQDIYTNSFYHYNIIIYRVCFTIAYMYVYIMLSRRIPMTYLELDQAIFADWNNLRWSLDVLCSFVSYCCTLKERSVLLCKLWVSQTHVDSTNQSDMKIYFHVTVRAFQISQTIKQRNDARKFAYTALDPENIPNAIEI